ncbi:hypothetical protein RFI_40309, partial [Reticulomyxa filosa]
MKSHLPNFQYVLRHPDIHLCIIDQIKIIQTQFNTLDDEGLIKDRLNLIQYLCISKKTSDIVVQCYKQVFKTHPEMCADLLCVISVKLDEQQLDDVIELFMDGLDNKNHITYAKLILKIVLNLNKGQLNKVFKCLVNAFESGKTTICNNCAHALATISSQLRGKQLDNAFQCLIHRFPSYFYVLYYDTTQFIMKLKEEQLGDVFQCLINRLSDEKEDERNRAKCAELLGKLSMKWNEKQLNDAFNPLKDMLNKNGDWKFNCEGIHKLDKYADLLKRIAQRLDEKQMNIALNYCMDKLNDKNEHQNIRIKCIRILERILNKCNEQQLDEAFNSSMDIFTDKNDNADLRKECAKLLKTIAVDLNGKHFDDAFQCFTNGLKDSDLIVRYSCVKSL